MWGRGRAAAWGGGEATLLPPGVAHFLAVRIPVPRPNPGPSSLRVPLEPPRGPQGPGGCSGRRYPRRPAWGREASSRMVERELTGTAESWNRPCQEGPQAFPGLRARRSSRGSRTGSWGACRGVAESCPHPAAVCCGQVSVGRAQADRPLLSLSVTMPLPRSGVPRDTQQPRTRWGLSEESQTTVPQPLLWFCGPWPLRQASWTPGPKSGPGIPTPVHLQL